MGRLKILRKRMIGIEHEPIPLNRALHSIHKILINISEFYIVQKQRFLILTIKNRHGIARIGGNTSSHREIVIIGKPGCEIAHIFSDKTLHGCAILNTTEAIEINKRAAAIPSYVSK